MSNTDTELLGFEIAFSLPDWFPPEHANYTYRTYYGPRERYAGQVKESFDKNHALDELHELPNLDTSAVSQTCGNWVTFKFENIGATQVDEKTKQCRRLLNDLIRKWTKPIFGHEYLAQKQGNSDRVFEVLDLTQDGEVVWVDSSYEGCQAWIDQPAGGRYIGICKSTIDGRFDNMGPFASEAAAYAWMAIYRPEPTWIDHDVKETEEEA